jgi:hypothetical protein
MKSAECRIGAVRRRDIQRDGWIATVDGAEIMGLLQ